MREMHELSEGRTGGSNRYVVGLLGEGVLASCSEDVRKVLLETSVPRTMSGPPCDAVTGREGYAIIRRGIAPIGSWFLWTRGGEW